MTQNTTDATEKQPRFIILKKGKLWETADGALRLDRFQPDNAYIPAADVPKDARDAVRDAIKQDILDVTRTPVQYYAQLDQEITSHRKRPKMVWTDIERESVKENREIPRDPSYSNHNIQVGETETEAFKFLANRSNKQARKEMAGYIGGMKTEQAVEFLQEMHYLETKGYNTTGHARDTVVTEIEKLLKQMGQSGNTISVSRVNMAKDAKNVKETSRVVIP